MTRFFDDDGEMLGFIFLVFIPFILPISLCALYCVTKWAWKKVAGK
jgi:hypothetical protein